MKILCLVDKYYPDASANTVCCENIMEYFKAQGHQVDFFAIKNDETDADFSVYNGSNVIKEGTYITKMMQKYGEKYNAKIWMDFPWFFRKFHGFVRKLQILFKRNTTQFISMDLLSPKKIYKKILKINDHYDCLFTFSMPFALNVIGEKLMKYGLADRWYPVFLDSFVYNDCLFKNKIDYRKKVAQRILKNADHIFMVEGIKRWNLKHDYNPYYHDKTTEILIPTLKKVEMPKSIKDNNKTVLVYTGGFYRDIRNPEKMFDIISKIQKDCEFKVYSRGCEDIVERKKELFQKESLLIGGYISHEQCLHEIANADFLVNLGNTMKHQMPSKILEYVGMGKPIINFYFIKEDMCLPILEKYPLVININLNDYSQDDIDKLIEFIKMNKGKALSYEEATQDLIDYRVENIAKVIYKETCHE